MKQNIQQGKRKRGGQPGNCNAFKHGLRSRGLTPAEKEELQVRIMLTASEQAVSLLRDKIASFHEPPKLCGFVGAETASEVSPTPGVKKVVRAFVLLDHSRLKGHINLKIHVTLPVPMVLTSQAALMESIHEMRAISRTTNESPKAP